MGVPISTICIFIIVSIPIHKHVCTPTHIHIDMGIYVNTHWYTSQVSWPEEILLFALLQNWWLPYLSLSHC